MKVKSKGRRPGKTTDMMELRVRMLFRNAVVSKSHLTLADTEVLKYVASKLGYDLKALATLDITDHDVNPYVDQEVGS